MTKFKRGQEVIYRYGKFVYKLRLIKKEIYNKKPHWKSYIVAYLENTPRMYDELDTNTFPEACMRPLSKLEQIL